MKSIITWHPANEPPDTDRSVLLKDGRFCTVAWCECGQWKNRLNSFRGISLGVSAEAVWADLPEVPEGEE